jgi:tRNA dimethylallyltransferase
MPPVIHVLTGATAVGKTEWALRWAEQRGAEIVSCDSLLFYRGMDIGTAKPTPTERAGVPHHLIDICDLSGRMDVTEYVKLARNAVEEILGRGRAILVTGGSGFYLKSFLGPVADDVAVPEPVRAEVAALPLASAVARLRELNPGGLGKLDTANPRRVQRALERCIASGHTLVQLAEEFGRQRGPFADFRVEVARLERSPADLERRIRERVAIMLRLGLVEEVTALRARGLEQNPSAVRAIGYREVLAMLDGKLPAGDLASEIEKNTRALVKKQRTWFRTQLPEHRVISAESVRGPEDFFGESAADL